jgi:hypothetical protein
VNRRIPAIVLLALCAGLLAAGTMGEDAKPSAEAAKPAPPTHAPDKAPVVEPFPAVPIRYIGNVMYMGTAGSGIIRLRVTVERWTTNDDRKKMVEALKSGGTDAVVSVMEKMNAGYLQLDNNLRWPVRTAAIWKVGADYKLRFATDRPIYWGEVAQSTRSLDYPIGIIELTLPAEGKGEGTLIAATQAGFDDEGRLEVRSLPTNTGPQRVTNVAIEK